MYETVSYAYGMQTQRSPRSRMSRERLTELFDAVHELLLEVGYERLTFDAVAARAHASKATLYRQWGSKMDLVMAALRHRPPVLPDFSGVTSLDDAFVQLAEWGDRPSARDLRMGFMLLYAASADSHFGDALRAQIVEPIVHEFTAIFETAADRGEIARDSPLFRRLAYLILTDLAFFPLISGQEETVASRRELLRKIVQQVGVS